MTTHPEEPPFRKLGSLYLVLKFAVLIAAALLTAKLLGLL